MTCVYRVTVLDSTRIVAGWPETCAAVAWLLDLSVAAASIAVESGDEVTLGNVDVREVGTNE